MKKMIKKILVFGVLAIGLYKGLDYYSAYTVFKKLASCPTATQITKDRSVSRENLLASTKAWRCVKDQQNFLETLFFKIPDSLVNPSIKYVNPPFTKEELGLNASNENFARDAILKRDALALVQFITADAINGIALDLSNFKITDSERYKGEVERKSLVLKQLVGALRDFKPESQKVMYLKTQLAYSFSQLRLTHEEGWQTYVVANKTFVASEALLAIPKHEQKLRRDELVKNTDELDSIELKFQSILAKEKTIINELLRLAEELDMLIKDTV
jgi:hypothetical protein